MTALQLFAAVCALWHLSYTAPLRVRTTLVADAATTHGVPVTLLAAVCWVESRLGTAPLYASLCGVRLNHRYVRDDAQSADIAGRSLAGLLRRCTTPRAALAAYNRDGRCDDPRGRGYASAVIETARRLDRVRGAR